PQGSTGPVGPGNTIYGELIIDNNSSGTSIPTQNTFVKITGFSVDEFLGTTCTGGATSTIVVNTAGVFQTLCVLSISSPSGSGHIFQFQIFKNNSGIADHTAIIRLATTDA